MPDYQKARLKYVKNFSIAETMKAMKTGERIVISRKILKSRTIRSRATQLNKQGYKFYVSTSGRKADTLIIKLKDVNEEQPKSAPLFSEDEKEQKKQGDDGQVLGDTSI